MAKFRRASSQFFRRLEILITSSFDRSTYFLIFISIIGLIYVSTLIVFTLLTKPLWNAERVFPFNYSDDYLPVF